MNYNKWKRFGNYVASGVLGFLSFSCDGHEAGNIPPSIEINREFPNNGKVKYRVEGKDSDGFVELIETRFNEEASVRFDGSEYSTTNEITQRDNVFEATVFDDRNAPATEVDSFRVAKRNEALDHIEALLINANAPYRRFSLEEPVFVNDRRFFVDFVVEHPKTLLLSYIKFVDLTDHLEQQMAYQRELDNFTDTKDGFRNLYLYRLPLDEVGNKVNEFIDKGYKR